MERRQFLRTAAGGCIVGLAGCISDVADVGGDGGSDGGGSDGGDTDTPGGDGSASDGGNGGDTDTPGGDGDGSDGDGTSDQPLASQMQYTDNYVAEMEFDQSVAAQRLTVWFDGDNKREKLETDEGTSEIYWVGEDTYLIQEGQCFKNPGGGMIPSPELTRDPTDEGDRTGTYVAPAGRDTIDGEEMHVYETTKGEPATFYVSVDTGYLRRFETNEVTVDYHSWGEVDPIEAPDQNCQAMGGSRIDDY